MSKPSLGQEPSSLAEPVSALTLGDDELVLRTFSEMDECELYEAFTAVVEANEGYPQRPEVIELSEFRDYWLHNMSLVVVARKGTEFVGSYYLKPNYPGRGAHIANAGYFVTQSRRGRGIGSAMLQHSIVSARKLGFDAMQFNLVFESNPARRLYERFGFEIVGRIPSAIDGEAAVIYWRRL